MRRWNGKGGGRRRGPCVLFSGAVSSGQIAGPVTDGAETDLSDAQCVPPGSVTDSGDFERVPSGSETDSSDLERCAQAVETYLGGAQCLPGEGPSRYDPKCGQREGPTCCLLLLWVLLDMLEMLNVWAVLVVLEQDDMTFWAWLLVVQPSCTWSCSWHGTACEAFESALGAH